MVQKELNVFIPDFWNNLPKAEIQEAEQLKLVSMERKRQGAVYLRSCDVSRVVMLAGRPMLETSNTVKQRKNGRLQMRLGMEDVICVVCIGNQMTTVLEAKDIFNKKV